MSSFVIVSLREGCIWATNTGALFNLAVILLPVIVMKADTEGSQINQSTLNMQ